jgi:hypothetical protein
MRRDAIEIAVAYGLIMAVEWTPRPLQRALWVVAGLGLALIVWRSLDGWRAMGFRAAMKSGKNATARYGTNASSAATALTGVIRAIFLIVRHSATVAAGKP